MEASTQPLPPPSSQAPAQAQAKAQPQAQSQQDPACNFCRVKKIKCDRKLPRCAHCKRNDLECSYSDKGKRVSQTSIVLNSLDAIQSRLGLIEGVLSTVAESLAKPEPQSDTWSVDSFDYTDYLPDVDDFDRDRFASQNPVVPTQPQIPNTCGWQDLSKLHGPGLLLSFGFQAYFVLAKHLAQNFHPNTAAQAEARENFSKYQDALYQSILRSMSSFEGLNIWHDDQLVALPPRALVDDVYDTFFTELNPIIPLFRPDSFRSLIAQVYATSTEVRDTASVVCINNVILETLIVKTKFRNPGSSVNSLDVGMSDLYALLLKNARRALAATKDFTSPRLINVQALLSLCIIAHESFEVGVAELMLEQACQLARMMGLNRKRQVPPEPSPTDYDEQRKVFWSLFIVDKQISFLMGNSCRLPSYDCDVPFPEDEHFQRHIVPRIRLARIQEQVYVDLYSAQAQGRSSADLHRRISKIRKSLDRWYKAHEEFFKGAIPEQELETSANAHMWLALNFNYYNTRIMVCRLATDEESRKLRLDDARMGLKIVFSARKLIGTNTGSALLRGLITFFPFVEYFEIFKDVVAYPSPTTAAENLTLLRGVVEILQDLCDNSTITSSYTAQLLLIASKHLDLASRYIEFANMNDSTNESLTRRSTHSSSDWSPLPNLLTQNQLDFQEFGANLFGAGNASLSTDDTNMSTDHAMGGAMQAWSSFDGRNGPFSNESIPVSTDLFNNDSAALSAFPSTSSMNSYLRFRCSRPAVVAPESDLGPRHDIDLDLGSFRSELTQDFVTPWQTINKGRL